MTPEQVKEKIRFIHTTKHIPLVEQAIKDLEADGWQVGIFAYRGKNTQSIATRHHPSRTLKRPRYHWRYVGYWFKGNEAIWYYNNRAVDKFQAVEFAKKCPLPVPVQERLKKGLSSPQDYIFAA